MRQRAAIALAALLAAYVAPSFAKDASTRTLDDFADASVWTAAASDQVSASIRRVGADGGHALCLDFDFHGVSGYAAMRRPLSIDYPADYEFDFRVRGSGADNALQFKLTDAANENVWWVNRADFAFPAEWTAQRYKKRQISFAWGPTTDHTLRHSEAIEFTVYAVNGGRGDVCFDALVLRAREPPPVVLPQPIASASSDTPGAPAASAVDVNPATYWRSGRDQEQTLTIDLGFEREFGGLVLDWHADAFAAYYDVELSDDAKHWRRVRRVTAGNGGVDPLYLPESEARYLRLALHGKNGAYALDEIEIKDLAFGATANAFFSALAKSAPRGWYPRGFYDEQTYWTVVGIDGGHETGLFSEDGALEVARGGFSIAPMLIDAGGAPTTWADVDISHSLDDGYLPIPSVTWRKDRLELTTTAFANGEPAASQLIAMYTLENDADRPRDVTLALLVQPFQVNPAVQFLNTPGGVSPIHELRLERGALSIDGTPRALALVAPDAALASPFDAGLAVEHIAAAAANARSAANSSTANFSVHDDTGLASGALLYRMQLAPHAKSTIGVLIPLDGAPPSPSLHSPDDAATWLETRRVETAALWRVNLNRTSVRVPPVAQPIVDTLRTALADILISRDGTEIRPGTRAYARSWIRDGAMMSAALLRLGHGDAARAYLEWYAPYQFRNGKVPCCVDARGSDPVPENDSHGELIYLAAEIYRYTADRALLESMWPHVDNAVRYMDDLRASERTRANDSDDRRVFRGLMPASISHEGYSAKPMHSYWDDFWALKGYKDAVEIAKALGRTNDAAEFARSRDEFRNDLYASIQHAVADHAIAYIPGSAELGDFDATSTTIALSPGGEQANLPQDLLHGTFEKYWAQFAARRDGSITWKDYTPYEWRTVSTFVRLGRRDRAQQAIDFFMHDRRPPEWNQWAEVVGRDARESRFVGDMPHGWVASDFIRSVLDLFAYEREADHALVIAAGIPDTWLDDDGVAVGNLRTSYGPLSYSLKRTGTTIRLEVSAGGFTLPPGGIAFVPPANGSAATATINGKRVEWNDSELVISGLPAIVEISAKRR